MTGLRVGIVGYGAVGRKITAELRAGLVPGVDICAILGSRSPADVRVSNLEALLARSDVVVECASGDAVREIISAVLDAGKTLVVLSSGALLDDELWPLVELTPQGRLVVSTGAVGGLDLLSAVRLGGSDVRVRLRTSKQPAALRQSWMSAEQVRDLESMRTESGPRQVFGGPAREAVVRFPRNLNVAAALAIAARDRDVRVELVADCAATLTTHDVTISSSIGEHRIVVRNAPNPDNPATSGIVPFAAIRAVADQCPTGPARLG